MNNIAEYCIAEHNIRVVFSANDSNNPKLTTSFEPFRTEDSNGDFLFTLSVDDTLKPIAKEHLNHIDTFDTGNGDTIVDQLDNGGYQYIIKDIEGRSCCLLQTNKDFSEGKCALRGNEQMRHFGLNNALMMLYAFRSSFFQTLLIHASLVRNNGYGYAFIAKSGTGKSTHTQLWLKHIPGSDLMNDDNPIVRVIDGQAFIYGSPWSGKTPCYRNVKAPLGAITQIIRAKQNSMEHLSPTIAFTYILPACSTMKWDNTVFRNTYDTVIKLIETAPYIYALHCLPDKEAAEVSYKTLSAPHQHSTSQATTPPCNPANQINQHGDNQ